MRDLRGAAAILCGLAVAGAAPLRAQTPDQPNLIFTISGGLTTGKTLWTLPRQLAYATTNGVQNLWDSMALGRDMRPGFLATLTATYFRSPNIGYTLEAGFFGLETKASCRPLAPFIPVGPSTSPNQQVCTYLDGQGIPGDAVGLLAGLTFRATKGGVQPYLRISGGGAIIGSSFVEMAGPTIVAGNETVTYFLADQHHKELTWMASVGAGVMLPLAPGYQLRLEARDVIVSLPYPTGPAMDTAAVAAGSQVPQPPVGSKVVLVPTFSVGFDIVLERRRGHRY